MRIIPTPLMAMLGLSLLGAIAGLWRIAQLGDRQVSREDGILCVHGGVK